MMGCHWNFISCQSLLFVYDLFLFGNVGEIEALKETIISNCRL